MVHHVHDDANAICHVLRHKQPTKTLLLTNWIHAFENKSYLALVWWIALNAKALWKGEDHKSS